MTDVNGSALAGNPAPAAGNEAPWYDSFADATTKEWTAQKGWKSPEAAAQSAWHLEKLMGADKAGRSVIWPKDEADVDGWKQIYSKLGRPETPDGYGLALGEGEDDSYLKHILPSLHQAGVPKAQAAKLFEAHNAYLKQFQEQQEAKEVEASNAQFAALQKEWGGDFEKNCEITRRAAKIAGLSDEQFQAIEKAVGVDVAAKVFAELGQGYVEHASPGHFNTGGDTATSARARIKELTADTEFATKLLNGDVAARSEWDKLHKIAAQV